MSVLKHKDGPNHHFPLLRCELYMSVLKHKDGPHRPSPLL